jgi:hemoglobin
VCGSVDSHFICGVSSIDQRLVMMLELGRLIEQTTHDAPVADAEPAASTSLFDRLGGTAAIDASVDLFYSKVMADPSISHFFKGTDLEAQKKMQRNFLSLAFGGPNRYSGRGMRAVHAPAVADGLSGKHFDAVIGHLRSTLADLHVPTPLIAEATGIAESVRADVLGQ